MPSFALHGEYTATFTPYRHGPGYVAKGTIFCSGKPVEIFEAHGRTMADTEQAAKAKADQVCKGLKKAKRIKRTGRTRRRKS